MKLRWFDKLWKQIICKLLNSIWNLFLAFQQRTRSQICADQVLFRLHISHNVQSLCVRLLTSLPCFTCLWSKKSDFLIARKVDSQYMVLASLKLTFKWEEVVLGCGVEFENNTAMTKELIEPCGVSAPRANISWPQKEGMPLGNRELFVMIDVCFITHKAGRVNN